MSKNSIELVLRIQRLNKTAISGARHITRPLACEWGGSYNTSCCQGDGPALLQASKETRALRDQVDTMTKSAWPKLLQEPYTAPLSPFCCVGGWVSFGVGTLFGFGEKLRSKFRGFSSLGGKPTDAAPICSDPLSAGPYPSQLCGLIPTRKCGRGRTCFLGRKGNTCWTPKKQNMLAGGRVEHGCFGGPPVFFQGPTFHPSDQVLGSSLLETRAHCVLRIPFLGDNPVQVVHSNKRKGVLGILLQSILPCLEGFSFLGFVVKGRHGKPLFWGTLFVPLY